MVVPRSLSSTAAAAARMREQPPPPVVVVTSAPHHAVLLMANGGGGGSGMSKDSDDQEQQLHRLHNSSMNNSSRTGLMVLMDDDSKRSNHHHVLYGMNDSTRLSHLRIFYAEHCIYLVPMLGWFVFSAALSTYNKYVFGDTHMNFRCPLLMTSIHFGLQWVVSHWLCRWFPITFGSERLSIMNWREWCAVSIPCGVVTSGDVGLSNLSLVRITMTFYTMVKSATPIFVLGWAYLFGIEQITCNLVLVVLIIAAGELLTVLGEVDFDHVGFILCLSASVLSGARWTLVQLKLRSIEPPIKSTIATMKLLSPSMFFSLLAFSLAFERPWVELQKYDADDFVQLLVLGAVGGTLAILMVLCEFHLIMHANAFLLMIGGVIKEMVTIMVGIFLFGDKLNLVNSSGVFVVFLGVFCYKLIHYYDAKKVQHHQVMASVVDDDDADEDDDPGSDEVEQPQREPIRVVNGAGGEEGLLLRRDLHNGIELPRNTSTSTAGSGSTHRHRDATYS